MTTHALRFADARVRSWLALALVLALSSCAYFAREATVAYMKVDAAISSKHVGIQIKRDFLERYKDRVDMDASFTVDESMQNAVAKAFDGDLHMSGRAPEIGLPAVAEIANASSEKPAIALVHLADSTKVPLRMSGVWRMWPEHAAHAKEKQGGGLDPLESNNPGHVFEIHPVTRINDIDLRDTFVPVKGFLPGDASTTFAIYQKVECQLEVKPGLVIITTEKGVYNDVEFQMQLLDDNQRTVPGGRFVLASANDLNGKLLVDSLRMVFAAGTPPELAVRGLHKGDKLHVFAMPRVSFAEISRRLQASASDPTLLHKSLPYEMIIIGVYPK